MRILFVCIGNICRSPIAEGLMRKKIRELGLDWKVDSAGTESLHVGEPPHLFSQLVCMEHGVDISEQRARRFRKSDFENFDKIYAMEREVYNSIQKMGADIPEAMLMNQVDYLVNELVPGSNGDVPDPWYGPQEGYQDVYELIDHATNAIIKNHLTYYE
jgi:protein-tyrosine phosphatase